MANAHLPSNALVYDVGMHNGDDSAYYLAKGCRVVAIDANPDMCRRAEHRFKKEIEQGRITILNVGLSETSGVETFFVNLAEDTLSTFAPDAWSNHPWVQQDWERMEVRTIPLSGVIGVFGEPWFVKIDIEFYDLKVLLDLMNHNIRPPLISVEAQHIDTFCVLVCMGYKRFRLVPGELVGESVSEARICRTDGTHSTYRFSRSSSGPFGDDLARDWLSKEEAFRELARIGPGWVDVHAAA